MVKGVKKESFRNFLRELLLSLFLLLVFLLRGNSFWPEAIGAALLPPLFGSSLRLVSTFQSEKKFEGWDWVWPTALLFSVLQLWLLGYSNAALAILSMWGFTLLLALVLWVCSIVFRWQRAYWWKRSQNRKMQERELRRRQRRKQRKHRNAQNTK